MIIYGANGNKLIEIEKLSKAAAGLQFKGKIMGTMPVTGTVLPSEARALWKLLDLPTALFLLTLPFRRNRRLRLP